MDQSLPMMISQCLQSRLVGLVEGQTQISPQSYAVNISIH